MCHVRDRNAYGFLVGNPKMNKSVGYQSAVGTEKKGVTNV